MEEAEIRKHIVDLVRVENYDPTVVEAFVASLSLQDLAPFGRLYLERMIGADERRKYVRDAEDRERIQVYRSSRAIEDSRQQPGRAIVNPSDALIERRKLLAEARQKAKDLGLPNVTALRKYEKEEADRVRAEQAEKRYEEGSRALERCMVAMRFTDSFLKKEFHLPDGTSTTWGYASVEEHRKVVAFLTKKIDSTQETVDLHLQVIEVILASGRQNLADARRESA